jgi:hypothetical protein
MSSVTNLHSAIYYASSDSQQLEQTDVTNHHFNYKTPKNKINYTKLYYFIKKRQYRRRVNYFLQQKARTVTVVDLIQEPEPLIEPAIEPNADFGIEIGDISE